VNADKLRHARGEAAVRTQSASREFELAESIEEAKRRAAQTTEENAVRLAALTANDEITEARRVASFKEALEKEIADAKRRNADASEEAAINLGRITTEQEDKIRAANLAIQEQEKRWHDIKPVVSTISRDFADMVFE